MSFFAKFLPYMMISQCFAVIFMRASLWKIIEYPKNLLHKEKKPLNLKPNFGFLVHHAPYKPKQLLCLQKVLIWFYLKKQWIRNALWGIEWGLLLLQEFFFFLPSSFFRKRINYNSWNYHIIFPMRAPKNRSRIHIVKM